MGSGLILLLIVGAWLAVLVPMALRSYDTATAASTVDRFSDAMRVLSRRSAGLPAPADDVPLVPPRAPRPRRGTTAAARRRRVLVVLVLVAVATLVGAVVGPVWLVAVHLLADLLLVGLLVWLRRTAEVLTGRERRTAVDGRPWTAVGARGARRRAEHAESRSRAAAQAPGAAAAAPAVGAPAAAPVAARVPAQPASSAPSGPSAQEVLAAAATVAAPRREQGVFDQEAFATGLATALPTGLLTGGSSAPGPSVTASSAPASSVPAPDAAVQSGAGRRTPVRGAQGEPWQPVPLPVPMYVTAARAPRRVLEVSVPGPAAAGHDVLAAAERSLGIDDQGPELEHILGRRAVGG